MQVTARRAVDPIIASLLLIAIAVAAGIIVYVYVNSIAGNLTQGGGSQTSERLQMQSYNFAFSPQACACSGYMIDLSLLNSGGGSTTISAVYYDGNALTLGTPTTSLATLASYANDYFPLPSSTIVNDYSATNCTATNGAAANICFTSASTQTTYTAQQTGQVVITFASAASAGTTHTVKVVSLTGATFVFTVSAGKTG